MKDKKLKPCPFCGGEAEVLDHINYYVGCSNCGVSTKGYGKEIKAVTAWNTRTNTIPVGNGKGYEVRNEG